MHAKHDSNRERTYEQINMKLEEQSGNQKHSPAETRNRFLEELIDHLGPDPISWCGFYRIKKNTEKLFLEENLPKPACSPIGRHGVCGRALREKEPVVVEDVRELGDDYVECDPDDRSEIVIPLQNSEGDWWGVFDADSHEVGAFDEVDVKWLTRLIERHVKHLVPRREKLKEEKPSQESNSSTSRSPS